MSGKANKTLIGAFVVGAVVIPLKETLDNPAALAWGGTLLLLAVPWALSLLRQRQAITQAQ